MTILDRTIARTYLVNAAVLAILLFSLVIAVDVALNFDEFVSRGTEIAKMGGEQSPGAIRRGVIAVSLVFDLWGPRLVQLLNPLAGLIMVAAMGFTYVQMVRNRELVAMIAGGISLWRAARPVLVCSVILAGAQLANQELLLPLVAPLLPRDARQAGMRTLGSASLSPTVDAAGRVFMARRFDADAGAIEGLYVLERDENKAAARSILADRAQWIGTGWKLENGTATGFGGADSLGTSRVDRIETNLDPLTLKIRRFASFKSSLSFQQATAMLNNPKLLDNPTVAQIDELERIRFGRFGVIACNLLAVVICLPFFLQREPKVMLVPTLKAAPLAMTALVGGTLGAAAAVPAVPPELSVFIPAMVCLPLAIAAITSVKT